jgi:hypothetical protein
VRQAIDDRLIGRHLAVVDPQRIRLRAPLAIAAQFRQVVAQGREQRFLKARTACGAPEGIDDELRLRDTERLDQAPPDRSLPHPPPDRQAEHFDVSV